jgi:hypothetical protein
MAFVLGYILNYCRILLNYLLADKRNKNCLVKVLTSRDAASVCRDMKAYETVISRGAPSNVGFTTNQTN